MLARDLLEARYSRPPALMSREELNESMQEAEMVEFRWDPWRVTCGIILRSGDLRDTDELLFLVLKGVRSFQYRTAATRQRGGARNVRSALAVGDDNTRLEIVFDDSSDVLTAIECASVILVGADYRRTPGLPDYVGHSEGEAVRLQPSWTTPIEIKKLLQLEIP